MTPSVTHRHVLQFLWRYARRQLPVLAVMVLLLLVVTGLQLLQPFFYKEALDALIGAEDQGAAVLRRASLFVVAGVLTALLNVSLREIASLMLGWVELRIMRSAHADAVAHVQRLSTQFHVNAFAGATSRKIGRGTDAVEAMMDRCWFDFLPAIVLMVGLAAVLTVFAPLIGVVMVAGSILYASVAVALSLVLARYHSWSDRQDTRVTASLVDAVTGNVTVKAFGAEAREDRRHDGVVAEHQRRLWSTWRVGTVTNWVQFVLLMGVELAVLLLGLLLWSRGQFTVGSFIVLLSYMQMLWDHLFNIGRHVREYLRASAHAEEMVELLTTPQGVEDVPGASALQVTRGAILFDRVCFHYGHQTRYIFENLTLSIVPGEKVAIVGHSGGGKSTLVKLLLRLYDVQGGHITIDERDIASVTQESLRRSIALVPQDPALFHRSLRENIAYGKPEASDVEIEKAARLAHVHEFIAGLPSGYDTLVGERGVKLSGGERQRVAIARAILADTPILVLDEATSSLDSVSEGYIQEALATLMEGRTVIAIAHRLSTIKKVDRIIVLEHGRIREEGTHEELLQRPDGIYRHFFELQAGGFLGE